RDPVITETRLRTERDPRPLRNEDKEHITVPVDRFEGLQALASPSARSLLEERILRPIGKYRSETAGSLIGNKKLYTAFNDWHKGVVADLNKVANRLAEAPRFYAAVNLRRLAHFARNPSERASLSRLVWNEATGAVEIAPRDD